MFIANLAGNGVSHGVTGVQCKLEIWCVNQVDDRYRGVNPVLRRPLKG
ncbi:hypothetical protein [Pedobacter sp.]